MTYCKWRSIFFPVWQMTSKRGTRLWSGEKFPKDFGVFLHRKWNVESFGNPVDLANSKQVAFLNWSLVLFKALLRLSIFTKQFFKEIVEEILFWLIGWTMVFKAVSGVNKRVYPTYISRQTSSEKNMAALDVTNKHKDHYKNKIVLKWGDFGASEVSWTWKGKVNVNFITVKRLIIQKHKFYYAFEFGFGLKTILIITLGGKRQVDQKWSP